MSRLAVAGLQRTVRSNAAPRIRNGETRGQTGLPSKFRARSSSTMRARASASSCPTTAAGEVFVHVSVLTRSGLDELQAGQRVSVWAEEHPRGLQATGVELI